MSKPAFIILGVHRSFDSLREAQFYRGMQSATWQDAHRVILENVLVVRRVSTQACHILFNDGKWVRYIPSPDAR